MLSSIEVAEPALAPAPPSEGLRVKIVADRAASVRLREVRQFQIAGCLERAEVLARDRYEGPMDQRDEVERRLLAQIDAAAVLGMRVPDILAFWEGNDPDPEVAWCTAFLLASWDEPGARPALSTWLQSLREAPFSAWLAATDALSASSHPELFDMLAESRTSSSSILRATAIDVLSQRQISPKGAGIPIPGTDPYLMLAALRAATRSPDIAPQPLLDAPFLVATDPDILREEARTRLILGDLRPVTNLHARVDDMPESAASLAVENLALAGDESLVGAAQALIARLPTSEALIEALGRFGVPELLHGALRALEEPELAATAWEALVTAFGAQVPETEPDPHGAWKKVLARFAERGGRHRGGLPWSPEAAVAEARRPEHSVRARRVRLDEIAARTGSRLAGDPARWGALGQDVWRNLPRGLRRD
ncbi:hypothetical protein [Polyangium jinanense]|uniref:Uncharacterized protein n=1 Tax=Polyangium jinanense TaxID=2829994 RepID=A0A9X4ATH9_9BACT|nr:hypothetical protein [Polyangium jinanense]MDC3982222.1 hypothetical protein [Polyangium jinanense]